MNSRSFLILTGALLGSLQFVSPPSSFLSGLSMCPLLCVLAESEDVFLNFVFGVFTIFLGLGTAAYIRGTDVVLLQCAVIVLFFHVDFTNGRLASSLCIYYQ